MAVRFLKTRRHSITKQSLRFTPTAYAKLLYMRDKGDSEVGGFGITSTADSMLITDFIVPKQKCTSVSTEMEEGLEEFMDTMIKSGLEPQQFMNIWIHTHPGSSPTPSSTDEKTFKKYFSNSNWAIMFIISKEDKLYCRLKFNVGPTGSMEIPVEIEYGCEFPSTDYKEWDEEYKNVTIEKEQFEIIDRNYKFNNIWDEEDWSERAVPDKNAIDDPEYYCDDNLLITIDQGEIWVEYDNNGKVYSYRYDPDIDKLLCASTGSIIKKEPNWLDIVREWCERHNHSTEPVSIFED